MADAVVMYSTAKGYVQSAYLLMANPDRFQIPDDSPFYLGFHMLAGFAVELYLKALLAKAGYSDRELKAPDVRHDLKKLLELGVAAGFSNEGAATLVDLLAAHHKSFEFRYMKPGSTYRAIDLGAVFDAFSSLDNMVDEAVGASASYGKGSGGHWAFPPDRAAWRFRP